MVQPNGPVRESACEVGSCRLRSARSHENVAHVTVTVAKNNQVVISRLCGVCRNRHESQQSCHHRKPRAFAHTVPPISVAVSYVIVRFDLTTPVGEKPSPNSFLLC